MKQLVMKETSSYPKECIVNSEQIETRLGRTINNYSGRASITRRKELMSAVKEDTWYDTN